MHAIVAVDENWGIGLDNKLLFDIPEDMQYFKDYTLGKVVVMGYNTLLSLPKSKPLPNRTNIVLCDDVSFKQENVIVCNSIPELLEAAKNYNPDEVIIIGGAAVYEQMLPFCETVLVTKVKAARSSDKFFPNLDQKENWAAESVSETKTHEDLEFNFYVYRNLKPIG